MDASWNFREAYEEARKIKEAQDSYCEKVTRGLWDHSEVKDKSFPYSLKWEALVDVLRGRVKVNSHTYEATDIDFLSRVSLACMSVLSSLTARIVDERVQVLNRGNSPCARSVSRPRYIEKIVSLLLISHLHF